MDKEDVVYTLGGLLLSLKKEGNSDMCYNVNREDTVLSEITSHKRTNTI